ncbi:MAG: hypothetical protein MJZ62_03530 [Bacteroidales bacterium]|nr:hypothetical protein [Bacteroidales bacterium]
MKKNLQMCIDLRTYLHNDELPLQGKPYQGTLTQVDDDMVYFVEKCHSEHRNRCLYNGKQLTMTISRDGQPRFNFKQLHMGPGFVEKTYILELINDLLHAFECLGEK